MDPMSKKGKLFIISAPSGAGKTSLVNVLLEELKDTYAIERVVTYTTKNPRAREENGKDYHFISREDFQRKVAEGFFLEWSGAYKDLYGSPLSLRKVLEEGRSQVLITDWQGAKTIKKKMAEALLIVIEVDEQLLQRRLAHRATETTLQQQVRMAIAQEEKDDQIRQRDLVDYIVVNDFFSDAVEKLKKIVVQALENIKN